MTIRLLTFLGDGKGFEENREANQRYHMEAQLKSPLWEKHLPRALVVMVIDISPLLEKGSGLGQRPLPSSGKRGWVIMLIDTTPLPRKERVIMVIDVLFPLLEAREGWP